MRKALLLATALLLPSAASAEPLDAAGVKALLSGATLDAVSQLERFKERSRKDRTFHVEVRADGSLSIVTFTGATDTGVWKVTAEGQYCSRYKQTRRGREKCFTVVRDGGAFAFVAADGSVSSIFSVRR